MGRELHGLCAEVTRLSLELSRLGEMQRRFPAMLRSVTGDSVREAASDPVAQILGRIGNNDDGPAGMGFGSNQAHGLEGNDAEFQQLVMALALAAALEEQNGTNLGRNQDMDLPGFVRYS